MSKNIRTVSLLVVLCVTGFSALRSYAEESPSGKTPISHQTKWEHYITNTLDGVSVSISDYRSSEGISRAMPTINFIGALWQDCKEHTNSPLSSV